MVVGAIADEFLEPAAGIPGGAGASTFGMGCMVALIRTRWMRAYLDGKD